MTWSTRTNITVVEEKSLLGITGALSTLPLSKAALCQSSCLTAVTCENISNSAEALAEGWVAR